MGDCFEIGPFTTVEGTYHVPTQNSPFWEPSDWIRDRDMDVLDESAAVDCHWLRITLGPISVAFLTNQCSTTTRPGAPPTCLRLGDMSRHAQQHFVVEYGEPSQTPETSAVGSRRTGEPLNQNEPPPKKKRITRACDHCHAKRMKCQGFQPCANCKPFSGSYTQQLFGLTPCQARRRGGRVPMTNHM
jgi:Fungal Zn(2)-Cys(6) binuclear cluster domain